LLITIINKQIRIENGMETTPVIIDLELNAPVEKVWKALTTKEDLDKWFFQVDDFKPEVGAKFKFYIGGEEQKYEHTCKILTMVKDKEFSYSWKYPDYDGYSIVKFLLSKTNSNNTHLSFTHSCTETFTKENPDFARSNFVDQWGEKINIFLREYVESEME